MAVGRCVIHCENVWSPFLLFPRNQKYAPWFIKHHKMLGHKILVGAIFLFLYSFFSYCILSKYITSVHLFILIEPLCRVLPNKIPNVLQFSWEKSYACATPSHLNQYKKYGLQKVLSTWSKAATQKTTMAMLLGWSTHISASNDTNDDLLSNSIYKHRNY